MIAMFCAYGVVTLAACQKHASRRVPNDEKWLLALFAWLLSFLGLGGFWETDLIIIEALTKCLTDVVAILLFPKGESGLQGAQFLFFE